jgi:hypothetical protein
MNSLEITSYRKLLSPLSQISAAREFVGQMEAFIQDTWSDLYSDDPPNEWPGEYEVLDALAKVRLRFERGSPNEDNPAEENYWDSEFRGDPIDALFHGWMHRVLSTLKIDIRLMHTALFWENLVFVPDPSHAARRARDLYEAAEEEAEDILDRDTALWEAVKRFSRAKPELRVAVPRGAGPRTSKPAVVDRIVLALHRAKAPMTSEAIAAAIKHKNTASVTAALHQIVSYGTPKRLAGWVRKRDEGHYEWSGPTEH